MSLDLKHRLLVTTPRGQYVVDPWVGGQLDLSAYGIQSYAVEFDEATGHFVVRVQHRLGSFVLDPFAGGAKPDLTAYGITDYEVVFGIPALAPGSSLTGNVQAWLGLGALLGAAWWMGRRKG